MYIWFIFSYLVNKNMDSTKLPCTLCKEYDKGVGFVYFVLFATVPYRIFTTIYYFLFHLFCIYWISIGLYLVLLSST